VLAVASRSLASQTVSVRNSLIFKKKCRCLIFKNVIQPVAGNLTLDFYVNWEMNCEFTRIGL